MKNPHANISKPVIVRVFLIAVGLLRAVISCIQNSIVVNVRIASISHAVSVDIRLIDVSDCWAIVAGISLLIGAIRVGVSLIGIVDQRAIVLRKIF